MPRDGTSRPLQFPTLDFSCTWNFASVFPYISKYFLDARNLMVVLDWGGLLYASDRRRIECNTRPEAERISIVGRKDISAKLDQACILDVLTSGLSR